MDTRTVCRQWLVDKLALHNNLWADKKTILVLGGSEFEPEMDLFPKTLFDITFAGIDKGLNTEFLNLNSPTNHTLTYDVIICNQVFEHLIKPHIAFENISKLSVPGSLVWITVPASNFRHGSPDFYSAGYSKEFLEKNMECMEFQKIELGELSCKRVYLFRHLMHIWPTSRQFKHPLFSKYGHPGTLPHKILYNLSTIYLRIILSRSDSKMEINGDHSIETFGLWIKK